MEMFSCRVAGEEIGLLKDHTDVPAHPGGAHLGDIFAADGDPALCWGVDLFQKQHERRLAAAGAAQDPQDLALGNGEIYVVNDGVLTVVRKADVFKFDVALDGVLRGIGGILPRSGWTECAPHG